MKLFRVLSWTVVSILFWMLTIQSHAGKKSVPLVPTNGKAVTLVINGHEKIYYSLTTSESITLNVEGPAKLQIITRLEMPYSSARPEKYSVKISEGAEVIKIYSTLTEHSEAILKGSATGVGKSRKVSFDVPKNKHVYKFTFESADAKRVFLKFVSTSMGSIHGVKGTSLQPLSYDRVVTAQVAENLITYYVSSIENPVQLRVIGPTKLSITARLNFDTTMKGEQRYTLGVWEGARRLLLKPLSTTKSLGVLYREWQEVIPGKTDVIAIEVPTGEHRYRFLLSETGAHSISLKFSIPRKDLGNTE